MKRIQKNLLTSRVFIIAGCFLFSIILFSACKKSNDSGVNTPVAALMAFNLAPDKSSIGIRLSGDNLVQAPLSYIGYTGGYISIYPGTSTIEAFDNSNTTFTSSPYSFDTSKYYSLFVVGNNGSYQNLVVNDNFDGLTATSGTAYVRFVNAIPDSSKPKLTITTGGNNIIDSNTGYTSVSQFIPIPSGDASVALTNEGTINTSRTFTLAEKQLYTVLLLGNPSATDSTQKVQIRFIQNGGL